MTTPVIYDLRNNTDAARFGLTPGERDVMLGMCSPRYGVRPSRIILHIQDGITVGSLDWWVNGYINGQKVQASATVLIQRDGSILRCIPEAFGAWTNGDIQSPSAQARQLLALSGSIHAHCLTIEFEGKPDVPLTLEQQAAGVWQIQDWESRYGIPHDREHVLPHSAINSVSRSRCPSATIYEPLFIAAAKGAKPVVVPSADYTKPVRPPAMKVGNIVGLTRVITAGAQGANRRVEPKTDADQTGPTIAPGQTFIAIGYVQGEAVGDEGRWWVGDSGSYVWVGGTVERPT